jgi:GNAT superfamily N-acetyltransferase
MKVGQVAVEPISYSETEGARELFFASENLPFRYHSGLKKEQLADYHFKKSCEALSAEKIRLFGAMVEGRPLGLLILERLPWDTEVLGINCFGIRDMIVPEGPAEEQLAEELVRYAVEHCASEGGELLVAKTDPSAHTAVRAMGFAGFELMSTLLVYGFDMKRGGVTSPKGPFQYRAFVEKDVEGMEELARKSFSGHFDRFTIDRRIPSESGARVHREWVKNACRGYADQVFVALDGDRVIGFSTWKLEKGTYDTLGVRMGHYDLAAVSPEYYGKGVFKGVTAVAMEWMAGKVDVLDGPTNIRNFPVQRGWTSLGWRIIGSRYNFHRWLK